MQQLKFWLFEIKKKSNKKPKLITETRSVNTFTHWSKQIFFDNIIHQTKWYFNYQALDHQLNIKSLTRVQGSPKSKEKLRSAGSSNCNLCCRTGEAEPCFIPVVPFVSSPCSYHFLTLYTPKTVGFDH